MWRPTGVLRGDGAASLCAGERRGVRLASNVLLFRESDLRAWLESFDENGGEAVTLAWRLRGLSVAVLKYCSGCRNLLARALTPVCGPGL